MPNCDRHWTRLEHDLSMLSKLSVSDLSIEWKITILFYISVHAVDAFLAKQEMPQHPNTHDKRKEYINPNGRFKLFSKEEYAVYSGLYSLSIKSRYMSEPGQTSYKRVSEDDFYKALKLTDKLISFICPKVGKSVSPVRLFCVNMANPSPLTFFLNWNASRPIAK